MRRPVFHAIQYLLGNQTREKLENFRGYKGAQSYPSRTKDIDDVDFSTGSVGLGVAQTLFSSLVQDYVHAHGWAKDRPEGRMIALVGDAEIDEGNIYEALLEGWKHGLRNCWWIVDYNRQSLDAVVREGLWERFEQLFRNFGWDVVILKYGIAASRRHSPSPAANELQALDRRLPQPALFGADVPGRRGLAQAAARRDRRSGPGLRADRAAHATPSSRALMTNLGGHDLPALLEAFEQRQHDRPVCFIAYTIKGFGLPFAGHKDNHAGLMTPTQMDSVPHAESASRRARNGTSSKG